MLPLGTSLAILIALVTQVQAYDDLLFTEDFFPLINARMDPIIFPGQVSAHVHHVLGSSAFIASESFNDTQTADCTTSNLIDDMSNYWSPMLFYKWKNGSYSAITGDGGSAYWKMPMTNLPSTGFSVVPDDFRMLAGDITRTTYNVSNALDQAVSFQCVDASGSYDKTPYMPSDRECLTLRPQVNFPECWNGQDAYVDDNSHVSYPIDGNPEGGLCPDTHPNKIPHLFLEATYHPSEDTIGEGYEWYPGCFVLATGDNYGYSFHADWLNGFPSGFIVDTYNECYDAASDTISKTCAPIDDGRAAAAPRDCVSRGQVVNEIVGQMTSILALPGNNPEYNSSETSKPSSSSYTEFASLITVSNDTQGVCVQGTCHDYAGSDIVVSSASDEGSSTTVSSVASGQAIASSSVTGSSTGSSTETAFSSPVSSETTLSSISPEITISSSTSPSETILSSASFSSLAQSSSTPAASADPGSVLVAVSDDSDDDGELVCERRKKRRRVAAW